LSAKEFITYSGELDREEFVDALQKLVPRFPLVMVAYGSGVSKRKAATGMLADEPVEQEHACGFLVVLCSNDMRGQNKQRADTYGLIGATVELLNGIQFQSGEGEEAIMLNTQPFRLETIECIARLPQLTAYALSFSTSFHHFSPDRRVVPGAVSEIDLNIDPANPPATLAESLPGVHAPRSL
jgi:hypothetical protein